MFFFRDAWEKRGTAQFPQVIICDPLFSGLLKGKSRLGWDTTRIAVEPDFLRLWQAPRCNKEESQLKKLQLLFTSTMFLLSLCIFLFSTTIAALSWGFHTATTAAAAAASSAIVARQAVAKAVMKTKAKARIRRSIAAVPVLGLGAIVYFEENDYRDWKEENPDGTRQEYGCEVLELTAIVIDEVLQELPEGVRPKPETILRKMPQCETDLAAEDLQAQAAI